MKKIFVMMFVLALGAGATNAQEVTNTEAVKTTEQAVSLCKEIYPDAERDGGLYHGLTRKLSFDRMIPPHGLEVSPTTRPCTSSFRRRCVTSISARRI